MLLVGPAARTNVTAVTVGPALYYEWYSGTSLLAAGESPVLTLGGGLIPSGGPLWVRASSSSMTVTSAPAQVTWLSFLPDLQVAFPTRPVAGSSLILQAENRPYTALRWTLNAQLLPGETNLTLTLTNAQQRNAGTYQVIYSTLSWEIPSSLLSVEIAPAPPGLELATPAVIAEAGDSITLGVAPSGTEPDLYLWSSGDEPPIAGVAPTVTLAPRPVYANTLCQVMASNALGTASPPAPIGVKVVPRATPGWLAAWGEPPYPGSRTPSSLGRVKGVAAGGRNSGAVGEDGRAWVWGLDWPSGLLPVGRPDGVAKIVAGDTTIGVLTTGGGVTISFPNGGTWTAPAALDLDQAGTSWVVAYAPGGTTPAGAPWYVDAAVREDGERALLAIDGTVTVSPGAPPPPEGLSDVVDIEAGSLHFLALRRDGTAVSWGDPVNAVPAGLPRIVAISAGGEPGLPGFSVGLQADGHIVTWGETNRHHLTPPEGWPKALAISAGRTYALAVLAEAAPPVSIREPVDTRVAAGMDTRLEWQIAEGAQAYQWFHDGQPVPGQTNAILALANVQAGSAGIYQAEVTTQAGVFRSRAARIDVRAAAPVVLQEPRDMLLHVRGSAWLEARAGGTEPVNFRWFHNGSEIPGARGSILPLMDVTATEAGSYEAEVTNQLGSARTRQVHVEVNPRPTGRLSLLDPSTGAVTGYEGEFIDFSSMSRGIVQHTIRAVGLTPSGMAAFLGREAQPILLPTPAGRRITEVAGSEEGALFLYADGGVLSPGSPYPAPPDATNIVAITTIGDWWAALRHDGTLLTWWHDLPVSRTDLGEAVQLTTAPYARTLAGAVIWFPTPSSGPWPDRPPPDGLGPMAWVGPGLGVLGDGSGVDWGYTSPATIFPSALHLSRLFPRTFFHRSLLGLDVDGRLRLVSPSAQDLVFIPAGLGRITVGEPVGNQLGILEIPAYPVVRQPQDQSLRVGDPLRLALEFQAAPPAIIQWYHDGLPMPSATNTTFALEATTRYNGGSYWASFSGPLGQDRTRTAQVTILSPPVFTRSPTGGSLPEGGGISLSAAVGGTAPYLLQWFRNGIGVPGAVSASLTLTNLDLGQDGSYELVASNAYGVVHSSPAQVTVMVPPKLPHPPPDVLGHPGLPIALSAEVTGHAPLHFEWRRLPDGPPIETARAELAFPSPTDTDEGSYQLTATNLYGAVTSSPVRLLIRSASPAFLASPSPQQATLGRSLTVSGSAVGRGPVRYQWLKWGEALPGATNQTLSVRAARWGDRGSYALTAYDQEGQSTSEPVLVDILPPPNVVAWDSLPTPLADIPPHLTNAVGIACSATHGLAVTEDGRVVGWGVNSNGCLEIPPDLTGIRSVTAGTGISLAITTEGQVVTWGTPPGGIGTLPHFTEPVRELAVGSSHALALTASGRVVGWGFNPTGAATIPPALTNAISIAAYDQFSFAVSSLGGFAQWGRNLATTVGPPGKLTTVRASSPTMVFTSTNAGVAGGVIRIGAVTNSRYTSTLSNIVDFQAGLVIAALTREGSLWGFGLPGGEFARLPYDLPPLTRIAENDQQGLGVFQVPWIIDAPPATQVREGESITLHGVAMARGPFSYGWMLNDRVLPGAVGPDLVIPSIRLDQQGAYTLFAYNTWGTNRAKATLVSVTPRIPVIARVLPATLNPLQPGDTLHLEASAIGDPPIRYQWYHNGRALPDGTNSILNLVLGAGSFGEYHVSAANTNGAGESMKIPVALSPPTFVLDDSSAEMGDLWFHTPGTSNTVGGSYHRVKVGANTSPAVYRVRVPIAGTYRLEFTQAPGLQPGAYYTVVSRWGAKSMTSVFTPTLSYPGGPPVWMDLGLLSVEAASEVTVSFGEYTTAPAGTWLATDAFRLTYQVAPIVLGAPDAFFPWVPEGTPYQLSVSAHGRPPLQFIWSKNGRLFQEAPVGQIEWEAIATSDAGRYDLMVVGPDGFVELPGPIQLGVLPRIRLAPGSPGPKVLEWDGPWSLQTASEIQGPWTDLPDATSPFPLQTGEHPRQFYRLVPAK